MAKLSLVKKIFGSRNKRVLNRMYKTVEKVNALEDSLKSLVDQDFKEKTNELKHQLQTGFTLEDILVRAFAYTREAAKRTLNMRHFDVQLIGGMALNNGKIAEMHTGEGKTLVATLPAYLNALTGKGVHIVTVNDYLAARDANWMRPIYEFLGLSVGIIVSDMNVSDRKAAYACDIVYGTNNEFGFDYLRDNMAFSIEEKVQREINYAIVDEVDSILIDEARTPLIISGPTEDYSELYKKVNNLIPQLTKQAQEDGPGDYSVDEKAKQVYLTEDGHQRVEEILGLNGMLEHDSSLYDTNNIILLHHINAALRAHALFTRDVDYIVRNNEVIIVDEHTGRTMVGRRWSDGLHQAVEAKENVVINSENQTLASITFQNYFRLYNKLAGMTGTADTEAYEFQQIYNLEVVVIPTNKMNKRKDLQDLVFMSSKGKYDFVLQDIKKCLETQQPVLVGTASIEASELVSNLLDKNNIKHKVLNAKFHQQEANIIADAGRPGSITIATNMAGRGTDIVLGGNLKAEIASLEDPSESELKSLQDDWQSRHKLVLEAGGLHVIGTERHESRRIDNQLRGRCARQGDPGSTRFYLSLEDTLMRIFASPGMVNFMRKLHTDDTAPLESSMLSKGIENAQRKVEGRNFDIRKQLLEFDDVANEQRKVIYGQRAKIMAVGDVAENIDNLIDEVLTTVVRTYIPENSVDEQWDLKDLQSSLASEYAINLNVSEWLDENKDKHDEELIEHIIELARVSYKQKEVQSSAEILRKFEKAVMLQSLDFFWKEHLSAMDHLRQSVSLRGYAQKDPKQEYKREAFSHFTDMLNKLKSQIISTILSVQVRAEDDVEAIEELRKKEAHIDEYDYHHASTSLLQDNNEKSAQDQESKVTQFVRSAPKQGRNELCSCGSNKKYKHCHGRLV